MCGGSIIFTRDYQWINHGFKTVYLHLWLLYETTSLHIYVTHRFCLLQPDKHSVVIHRHRYKIDHAVSARVINYIMYLFMFKIGFGDILLNVQLVKEYILPNGSSSICADKSLVIFICVGGCVVLTNRFKLLRKSSEENR